MYDSRKDFYQILGVPEESTQDEIRTAYRDLAKKYHPDKTGGDKKAEEKLKKINEAYDVLKKPEKRKEYDEARRDPFTAGSESGGFTTARWGSQDVSFEDLFGEVFGGRRNPDGGPQRGKDIEVELTVPLRDIVEGVSRTLRVPVTSACDNCKGSGAAPGSKPVACQNCQGTGVLSAGGGGYFVRQTCARCRGSGTTNSTSCSTCGGAGKTRARKTVSVRIPAGAATGLRLRVAGHGDSGEFGGSPGDLFVVVQVKEDPVFRRDGQNVMIEAPVSSVDLALGVTIRVPTLTGAANLKIPPGTASGKVFRLSGLGLAVVNGSHKGSLLVEVVGQTPQNLTVEQRELLEEFKRSETDSTYRVPRHPP